MQTSKEVSINSVSSILPALICLLLVLRGLSDFGASSGSNVLPATAINGGVAIALTSLVLFYTNALLSDNNRSKTGVAFFAVLAFTLVGLFIHGFNLSMLQETVKWGSIIALYTLSGRVVGMGLQGKLLNYAKYSLLAISALVFFLGIGGVAFSLQYDGRFAGTLSHSNSAASLIGLAIICLLVIDRGPSKLPKLIFMAVLLAGLFYTGSLGGVVSTACALVVWYAVRRERVFSVIALATTLIAAFFFFLTNFTTIGNKISFLDSERLGGAAYSLVATNSGEWRIVNWVLLLGKWAESPVFGQGLGSTSEVVAPLGAPPHSMIIQVLVETGLIGLIIALFASIRYSTRILNRRQEENFAKAFVLVIFVLVAGFQSNLLLYTPTMYFLAVLFGALRTNFPQEGSPSERSEA